MFKKLFVLAMVLGMSGMMASVVRAEKSVEEIQILDFAKRPDVIAAMKDLKADFTKVREQNGITDVTELKTKLGGYYTEQFGKEYTNKNQGKSADTAAMLGQLDDDSIALQYYYVIENPNPLGSKHLLDASANDKSTWTQHHKVFHPGAREYLTQFGLYDIFLVDPDTGDVVYTCFKELDFTTNLKDGLYAKTGLGDVFQAVNSSTEKDATKISDMSPYLPSYDLPARFVAAPVYDGEQKVGVVIFQLPTGM
jgi:methyl-accepting chemotaxis protein